jgi:hypothetical protein
MDLLEHPDSTSANKPLIPMFNKTSTEWPQGYEKEKMNMSTSSYCMSQVERQQIL